MSALSVITAIHNGLDMNRFFWKFLSENTTAPFELIILDNHSTDGSSEFFESLSKLSLKNQKVVHVKNPKNQFYAVSQNQGRKLAHFDVLCFLNNDIWLPYGWNEPFQKLLLENPLYVLSPSGQEAQPTQRESCRLKSRWKKIQTFSKAWKKLFHKTEEERLWKSLEWMYGSLKDFKSPTQKKGIMPGIKGDAVICHQVFFEKFPSLWDETVDASDWHLYLTVAMHHQKDPQIPLPQVVLDVYGHHFGRYSAKLPFEPYPIPPHTLSEVWGEKVKELWWGYSLPS